MRSWDLKYEQNLASFGDSGDYSKERQQERGPETIRPHGAPRTQRNSVGGSGGGPVCLKGVQMSVRPEDVSFVNLIKEFGFLSQELCRALQRPPAGPGRRSQTGRAETRPERDQASRRERWREVNRVRIPEVTSLPPALSPGRGRG